MREWWGASSLDFDGRLPGITKQYSIRPEMKPQVERWLENYQLLKSKLEEICELNHVLIRPEE